MLFKFLTGLRKLPFSYIFRTAAGRATNALPYAATQGVSPATSSAGTGGATGFCGSPTQAKPSPHANAGAESVYLRSTLTH